MNIPSESIRFIGLLCGLLALMVHATWGQAASTEPRPKRIVCLAPSLCELAADVLGPKIDRIVGVAEQSDYPPSLKEVPSVGPFHRVHLEKIASLKPALVLATRDGNSRDQIRRLKELGLRVEVVESASISEIRQSMIRVARAIGFPEKGQAMSRQLERGVTALRRRGEKRIPRKVLLQVGAEPLVVVGSRSFLNEALEIVGAKNVYGDLKQSYPRPTLEDVVSRNPDQIVVLAMGENLRPFQKMAERWKSLPLRAARRDAVSLLKSDALLRPSLRLLEGLNVLEKTVYGD